MLGKILANSFIKASQSPVFDDPGNYGLDYENISFKAKDGVELSGWLIKGSHEKEMLWIEVPKKKTALQNRLACHDWLGTHPQPIIDWFDYYMI